MRILIVTNNNGIGLQTDAELLFGYLTKRNHTVTIAQYDQPCPGQYDLGISLEVVAPTLLQQARRWWYFANPEWLRPEYIPIIKSHYERVFAKTHIAERELKRVFDNVEYVGFLTRDRRDETVPRERRFLHIGGNSGYRGTQEVLAAWREYRYWEAGNDRRGVCFGSNSVLRGPDAVGGMDDPQLTIVTRSKEVVTIPTPGVTFLSYVDDAEITRLQNSHIFHLYPSGYEGWGQALHEAQSVGAVIMTTDAEPMQDFGCPYRVKSVGNRRVNLGDVHTVDPVDIRKTVNQMSGLTDEHIGWLSQDARLRFHMSNSLFDHRFGKFLIEPVGGDKVRLAMIGNFDPPYSTESDLKWTLEDMGYEVIACQENVVDAPTILEYCVAQEVRLVLYVHTHGWTTPGKYGMNTLIRKLRDAGIKTASFHLDRYWGLNQLDQRESQIGSHPFWHTDYVFTADGGNDERFAQRKVNHRWLAPGVVKRDCYIGTYRPELSSDVGFVGATSYHPEYPGRECLIAFLQTRYGDRFRVYQGYRGDMLNDVYASCKVLVGDSCFAGSDYYWSDRIPETLGRGGFLIHPQSRGLNIPGLVTFEAGKWDQLAERIDYYLVHEVERTELQTASFAWVRSHETYHERMREVLRMCL